MQMNKLAASLAVALFLSLTANVFMGGVLVGRHYSGPGPAHDARDGGNAPDSRRTAWQQREKTLREKLSKPDLEIVKKEMSARRGQFKDLRQQLDDAEQKVREAADAEPFDQSALDDALRAEREKKTELLKLMRQTKDEVSRQLSPEGRAAFEKFGPGHMGGDGPGGRRRMRDGGFNGPGPRGSGGPGPGTDGQAGQDGPPPPPGDGPPPEP